MADVDDLAAVRAHVAAGDDDAALARVRERLRWPRGKQLDDLAAWLGVLADVVALRGAGELAEVARQAVRDPDSPDTLYDLGYALIDAGAPSIAASVLWHCLALVGDSEEVVCELVSALESALAYDDAFAILEEHAALRARSFLCAYLHAFNAAMTGKLEIARSTHAALVPDSPETEAMKDTIAAILARADRVSSIVTLDRKDLRGWQYVLTGTLVAHMSPYGFDEPMHGRYAWLQDSIAQVAYGITRLEPLARAANVPCVYAPPGRDHEIVAQAIATRLGVPLVPFPTIGVPAPGLIAVYDLATLDPAETPRLLQRRPDQVLYAHACSWTHDAPVAPDITTLLYQSLVPPWGEKLIVEPDTHAVTRQPPDARDVDAIVADILASPGLDGDEIVSDDLARWDALVAATWPPEPGPRARMWAGGPVPSNRFE